LLQEAFDFPAQITRRILHSLRSGEHSLGGAARLHCSIRHFAERVDDVLRTHRRTGDVIRDLTRGGVRSWTDEETAAVC
jgi:hypothetical protein